MGGGLDPSARVKKIIKITLVPRLGSTYFKHLGVLPLDELILELVESFARLIEMLMSTLCVL